MRGEVFEAFQKITDETPVPMQALPGKVEKLISQSSFQLKGTGWYLTDYARRNSSGSADKPKSSDASEKATDTKTSTDTPKATPSSEIDIIRAGGNMQFSTPQRNLVFQALDEAEDRTAGYYCIPPFRWSNCVTIC